MNEHYYTENPASEIREKKFDQEISGTTLTFTSVSGVFSFESKVDRASILLLKNFQPTGRTVLDIGCGYGAIGLFIKAMHKTTALLLADINRRAVDYAIINAKNNSLDVTVLKSDLYSNLTGMLFDDIVTNPPISAGKKLNLELINESWEHLNQGGSLWLTAFHNKGGSALKEVMKARFDNVEDMDKSGGIRVYKSVKQHG